MCVRVPVSVCVCLFFVHVRLFATVGVKGKKVLLDEAEDSSTSCGENVRDKQLRLLRLHLLVIVSDRLRNAGLCHAHTLNSAPAL